MVKTSELMSIKEVSEVKDITVGRVYQLINEGTLPAQKVGNHYIIAKSDCDSLIVHGKPGRPKKSKSIKGNGKTDG
ncbi:hypothetical protein BH20ACI1_BH20ACI1_17650 [soil metagenome]